MVLVMKLTFAVMMVILGFCNNDNDDKEGKDDHLMVMVMVIVVMTEIKTNMKMIQ